MAIKLTEAEIEEQFQEAGEEELQWDPLDKLDITYKFDNRISNGWRREIQLREGTELHFDQHQINEQWSISTFEGERSIIWICFILSGQEALVSASCPSRYEVFSKARKYRIGSNGLLDQKIFNYSDTERHSRLYISVQLETLRSFANILDGELPVGIRHLIKSPNEAAYERDRSIQPLMNSVIRQILQCPYQGMVKRAYLESKTIELIALVLDHESSIQRGESNRGPLKPEQIERIYYARELLLKDLSNPPTLEQLAHQVGLNDFLLKQGFHQVFESTVFGQLQTHRLEMAKSLLAEQDINVSKVARLIGYVRPSSFSKAFKQRFGLTPKEYQKIHR